MSSSRRPVKATYAHKRARNRRQTTSNLHISSPLQVLADGDDDLSRSEMTRRMLKRSRQAAQAITQAELQGPNQVQEPERRSKRLKRVNASSAGTREDYILSLDDLRPVDPTDASLFQTPFGEEYIHPSLVQKPLVPEQMSPLPVATRMLSRTTSRNLKENATSSRPTSSKSLASPFISRHNSANSSPGTKLNPKSRGKSKAIAKSSTQRPALTTKSHSTNSTSQNEFKAQSQPQLQDHEPIFTMNHSAQNSPRRAPNPLARNRYPSSHTLTQISRPDWFIPPKVLTRSDTPLDSDDEMYTPPDFGVVGSVRSSSFLADVPIAFSTPLPRRPPQLDPDMNTGVYASGSGLYALGNDFDIPAFLHEVDPFRAHVPSLDNPPNVGNEAAQNDGDVVMTDVGRPRKTLHISKNSIISSSGDFTLAPSNPAITNLHNNSNDPGPDSLFPSRDEFTVQSELTHLENAPTVHRKQSLLQNNITMFPLLSSPVLARSHSSAFVDNLMAAKVPAPIPSSPPQRMAEADNPESVLKTMFDYMELNAGSNRPSFPFRAHSLDSPASVQVDPATTAKDKPKSTRARAGTIRASDFQQARAPPTALDGNSNANASVSYARRTRSGTVVGPSASSAIVASTVLSHDARIATSSRSKGCVLPLPRVEDVGMESEDELLLKGRLDADLKYLGLPGRMLRSSRKVFEIEDESDDELLLSGKWMEI